MLEALDFGTLPTGLATEDRSHAIHVVALYLPGRPGDVGWKIESPPTRSLLSVQKLSRQTDVMKQYRCRSLLYRL
jgi:hypothetical protein